ncbi:MAG: amino acid adenylation domain-containing protein [Cytophagales bacterium]|nr:amino acid adenylation domain-containing protein [Cytophagales bacterium]
MQANQTIVNKQDQLAALFQKKGLEIRPISHIQSNIWFQSQLNPDLNIAYNLRRGFLIKGPLDVEKFRSSLQHMIIQHEALRTIFMEVGGSPVKLVRVAAPTIELILEQIPEAEELTNFLQQTADIPFELGQENLFRFRMFQLAKGQYAFLMVVHHIICDGYAIDLMLKEISLGYESWTSENSRMALPEQKAQSAAPSVESLHYWKERLQHFPKLHNLPTDFTRPASLSYLGEKITRTFDQKLTDLINTYVRQNNTTPFIALLSVWSLLMSKMSGDKKLVIGFPLSTRDEDTTDNIDLLVESMPLGIEINEQHTFNEHVASVRQQFFQAYSHRNVSSSELSEQLDLERNLSYHPLYQLAFTFLENKQQLRLRDTQTNELAVSKSRIKMDLEFHIELDPHKNYQCNVHYNIGLFKSSTIDQYINRFLALAETCFRRSNQLQRELPLVSEAEAKKLRQFSTGKSLATPNQCVHQVFEQHALQSPDDIALIYRDQEMTFVELNRMANQLAYCLLDKASNETFIGLFLAPGLEMIVGMLGVMKAGKAYVPIDPAYPEKRIQFILDDSGVTTLFTNVNEGKIKSSQCLMLADCSTYPDHNPKLDGAPEDLIYMIYTSGTTGLPKGVPIPHQGMINYTWSKIDRHKIVPKESSLQLMSLSFDAFGSEAFPTLLTGGSLVLIDKLSDMNLADLGKIIAKHRISRLSAVPSTLKLMLDHLESYDLSSVRTIILGGEKPDQELFEKIKGLKSDISLFNEYGPTENSIASTSGPLDPTATANIGVPVANGIATLLDDNGLLVPTGISGELCVGGPGLTSGYFGYPELTEAKFFTSSLFSGKTLYRTGDRARWDDQGNIHFIGRTDDQVKVNGVRIELEEIRQSLLDFSEIKDCVVVPQKATLVAIVQPEASISSLNIEALSIYLGEHLPHYMIPTSFRKIDQFPVTTHGKIDLQYLLKHSLPITPIEETIKGPIDQEMVNILKNAWSKILSVDQALIDPSSNFFDMGGHSLLLGKLTSAINKETDLTIDKTDFFKYPSINAMIRAKSNNGQVKSEDAGPSRAEIRKNQRNKRLKRQQ